MPACVSAKDLSFVERILQRARRDNTPRGVLSFFIMLKKKSLDKTEALVYHCTS